MIGLRLTRNSDGRLDLLMENGQFVMAEDGEAAASALTLRMHIERNECIDSPIVDTTEDPLAGVDIYGILLDVSKSRAEKELELRRAILASPNIEKIIRITWTQVGHIAYPEIDVQTAWGSESVSQQVIPL